MRTTQQANNTSSDDVEQQLAKLRDDLTQAQQDADNLRASASVNLSIANVSVEDSSKPIAEQVAEHVQAVRAELEARHKERVKEADEILEKRTSTMKTQLTKKLTEGKAQIRQSLIADHEETIKKIKIEHDAEMEKLATRHKDEMEELKQNENVRFAKLQEDWQKERLALRNGEASSSINAEGETSHSPWQPSEAEAKVFIQSNEVARTIMRNNIKTQVNKAKDELAAQLKEEHEKVMAESQNKANTAKEHAVMMEGKKTALQVNMANNKSRIAQHKIGIVEKAVQETPQKPVKEVWDVAKDAKPPPAAPPQAQQGPPKTQQTPVIAISAQPTSSASNAGASQQKPAPKFFGQVSQNSPTGQQQLTQANQLAPQASAITFGRPSPAALPIEAASPSGQGNSAQQQTAQSQQPPNTANGDKNPSSNQTPLAPQQKPSEPTPNHHPNAGTGPGALRGLQQSGLPVARGGSVRGSVRGNPTARGRGSGTSRGAPQGINTNQAQQQGRNSPTSSGMNPGAKQFVPGNKRPRDDEQQSGDASHGKRIRGGGGGA